MEVKAIDLGTPVEYSLQVPREAMVGGFVQMGSEALTFRRGKQKKKKTPEKNRKRVLLFFVGQSCGGAF